MAARQRNALEQAKLYSEQQLVDDDTKENVKMRKNDDMFERSCLGCAMLMKENQDLKMVYNKQKEKFEELLQLRESQLKLVKEQLALSEKELKLSREEFDMKAVMSSSTIVVNISDE